LWRLFINKALIIAILKSFTREWCGWQWKDSFLCYVQFYCHKKINCLDMTLDLSDSLLMMTLRGSLPEVQR